MTRTILLALLVALWALPATAVDVGHYPSTLVDDTCTDSNDTPAAGPKGMRPAVQISGSADGFCDHDSRIIEVAIEANAVFGPFKRAPDSRGIVIFADANVVSNDTETWKVALQVMIPATGTLTTVGLGTERATEALHLNGFGSGEYGTPAMTGVSHIDVALPLVFYINLNLVTATSWEGLISWVSY